MLARSGSSAAPYRFQQCCSNGKPFHTPLDSNLVHEGSDASETISVKSNAYLWVVYTHACTSILSSIGVSYTLSESNTELDAKMSLHYHEISSLWHTSTEFRPVFKGSHEKQINPNTRFNTYIILVQPRSIL